MYQNDGTVLCDNGQEDDGHLTASYTHGTTATNSNRTFFQYTNVASRMQRKQSFKPTSIKAMVVVQGLPFLL